MNNKSKEVHGNAEGMNNTPLISYEEVEKTPFTIATVLNEHVDKTEFYIMMGKYRLSEMLLDKKVAIIQAKEMTWNRIMQVIGVMHEELNQKAPKKVQTVHDVIKEKITNNK